MSLVCVRKSGAAELEDGSVGKVLPGKHEALDLNLWRVRTKPAIQVDSLCL